MDIKPVSSRAKAVAMGLLIACSSLAGTAFAATPTGFQLDYFHAYKASKTYAIQLKNGLKASFDLENGTATLDDGSTQITLPLEQVLLEANNGNVQAAAEMYDQMYQDINSAHSDAIMAYVGPGGYGTHGIFDPPRWDDGIGGLNDPMWGMPGQGDCWPIPFPCHEWSGGLSDWGAYNQWWNSPFGDPPPTPQPPRPDGCAPNDIHCIVWEDDRQDACDDLPMDNIEAYGLTGFAGAICGGSLGTACGAGIFVAVIAINNLHKDQKQCRTPYPG